MQVCCEASECWRWFSDMGANLGFLTRKRILKNQSYYTLLLFVELVACALHRVESRFFVTGRGGDVGQGAMSLWLSKTVRAVLWSFLDTRAAGENT